MAYNALESENDFLVVVDTSNELIESCLKQFENCKKRHTFVRLISMTKLLKYRNQDTQILLLGGIKELIISDSERVYLSKNPESIKCCLHRCFRKIKGRTLETITFKNLEFEEQLTKIKVPARDGLKIIKLKGSKMIPAANFEQLELKNVSFKSSEIKTLCENVRGIKSLFISGNEKHIFENMKIITSFWYYCPTLEMIETAKCTIGQNKLFRIKIEKNEIDECCKFSFSKHSSSCTINELTCMVHHVINRQMLSQFTRDDFENSNGKAEKQFIMDAICYRLLQRHDSYVSVYPAKYKGEGETTLVCLTKENNQNVLLQTLPDLEQRREYVGFKTEEKNVYSFSAANVSCPQEVFDDQLKKYYVNHFDNINEVIAFHAERLLNEHKNLISVSVSLGKVRNEYVDVTLGPHIVLYVNAKSYIPFFEKAFPEELKHNNYVNIVYPVDVREGYFISMADSVSNRRAQDKLTKLAMGCSIGAENGKTGGTMGPLVEYKTSNNLTCLGFLTACHIFRKPEDACRALNTIVVQPSDIDELVDLNGVIRQTPNKKCGQIVACRYSEYVDAALVRIDERHPTATNFISPTYDDLNNAGFSPFGSFGLPKYQHGRSLHESQLTVRNGNADKRIVKFGKVTGLRRGDLMLDQTVVRLRNYTLKGHCPSSQPLKVEFRHELKHQMAVMSSPESSFFQKGDSGCGVFLADSNNDLWCIGVGIGMLSDSVTIVTPIHKILEELQSCVGISEIRLKSFEAEEMIT
ncbi:uncharacterized protein LOC132737776 [Ruditapes philippinarum]|uniref:uncharacterized protein LOC132737776 n=1 Tax=Ruditapes philippinarum TaxID=129788 RepID=UPI00295A72FF|nr:uncharacterized protein LOC132737776 [Ruditapes philippinarum]